MGGWFGHHLSSRITWLATTPTGRLAATSILWALAISGMARYDNGHLWVGFFLGLLLPITMWIAYEGFWLPKRSRLDYFLALTPTEFEHAVADLLRPLGFTEIRVVGGVNDYGVDVLCLDSGGNPLRSSASATSRTTTSARRRCRPSWAAWSRTRQRRGSWSRHRPSAAQRGSWRRARTSG